METFESLNMETVETYDGTRREPSGNLEREGHGIKNKWFYLTIPIVAIAFAEIMIYLGRITQAMGIHALILLGLSLSTMFVKNEEMKKTYQALILLPILRLVDISMPIFYDVKLYNLIFIYSLLAIPVSIAATSQEFTRTQLGITFKKIEIYIPLSILLGFLLGAGEYMIAGKHLLIQDISVYSLLTLSIIMIFFVGLVEEIIFRSILQNRLEIVLGNREGLIITGILFGLMNSGYGSINEILYTSFVGILIGYLFYRTRSLPLVVLIHGFINVFFFGIIPFLF